MLDPIADMITRIWNAGKAGRESLSLPYSKIKMAIADLLVKEKYLKSAVKRGKKIVKFIDMELFYDGKKPKIQGVDRISKFSRRVYKKSKDLHAIRQGYGKLILSTPKGILTGGQAKRMKVGGEVLFKIW